MFIVVVVGEFTIGPIRTPEELDFACQFLLRIFPSLPAGWAGPRFFRGRLAGQSPMMLAAKHGEEIAGVVLGHVDGSGLGTVDHLAVAAAVRGRGLGRGLLSALESGARSLGVRQLTLGSVDGAVGFYERCGYRGRLLLQFVPPARRDEVAPLFAGFALLETQWQSVPQLWVQTPRVDYPGRPRQGPGRRPRPMGNGQGPELSCRDRASVVRPRCLVNSCERTAAERLSLAGLRAKSALVLGDYGLPHALIP